MAAVTVHSDFRAQEEEVCHYFHLFPVCLCAMILVFWMLSFKPAFSLASFTLIKRLFSSSLLSAIKSGIIHISEVVDVSPAYLDSILQLIQPGISHDVLSLFVKQTGWQQTALSYSFLNPEPISCSIQGSNCCFMTCIQVSQKTGKMIWYSHLSKSFPQFVMIHTVKGFSVVDGNRYFPEIPLLSL